MTRIPILTSKKLVKILHQHGFIVKRQRSSHAQFFRKSDRISFTIPIHNCDIKKGLLIAILKKAKIDINDL